jgi:drug/metabolite transporter (DMT)-like permease
LGYTAANICLRQSAAMQIDPAWVICVKETVAVAVVGPWLLLQIVRGERFALPARALVVLVLAGLGVQLLGNLNIQWAFGVVGLAISMPVVFGAMLIGSALIGLLAFGETLPLRSVLAVALVIAAIGLLGFGAARADSSEETMPAASSPSLILLGIAAAGVGGVTFATLGAAIRYSAQTHVPVIVTVLVVTGMGCISLAAVTLVRLGPAQMLGTDPAALAWMVASGAFNLGAFALIIKGLQLTTLVHANVLNVSQAALGAAAGVLLFREPHNAWLVAGIGLTLVGIAIFRPPGRVSPADPQRKGC